MDVSFDYEQQGVPSKTLKIIFKRTKTQKLYFKQHLLLFTVIYGKYSLDIVGITNVVSM